MVAAGPDINPAIGDGQQQIGEKKARVATKKDQICKKKARIVNWEDQSCKKNARVGDWEQPIINWEQPIVDWKVRHREKLAKMRNFALLLKVAIWACPSGTGFNYQKLLPTKSSRPGLPRSNGVPWPNLGKETLLHRDEPEGGIHFDQIESGFRTC